MIILVSISDHSIRPTIYKHNLLGRLQNKVRLSLLAIFSTSIITGKNSKRAVLYALRC